MSQGQSSISTDSKNIGTPYFGRISDIPNNNQHIGISHAGYYNEENNQKNIPETILEKSSNSSEDELGDKIFNMMDYNQNHEMQLVIVKEQAEPKAKIITREKSKSDYNGIVLLTQNSNPFLKADKQSDILYSSLGVPAVGESSRKKTVLDEKQAEEDCKVCKSGGWTRTKLMLTQTRLAFFEFSLDIVDLQKIKILPWSNYSKTKSENIIKIVFKNQVQLFSLSTDKKGYKVPISYHIFAKLIEKKLLETNSFEISNWQKQEHRYKKVIEDSFIYGHIYKRSQLLGNWEKRFVVIKKSGIFSYRSSTEEQNYSFYISSDSVKYIWTRFQKVEGFLIVKIKHGLYKTQFGIPICEFSVRSPVNWLYYLYRVLPVLELDNS